MKKLFITVTMLLALTSCIEREIDQAKEEINGKTKKADKFHEIGPTVPIPPR
jgi:hypothetical protein